MLTHDIPKQTFLKSLVRAEPLIKDHTAVKTFMECPRKYFYRMVCGRQAKKPEMETIFGWGTAVHKFAEVYQLTQDKADAFMQAMALYKKPFPGTKWDFLDEIRFAETIKALRTFIDNEVKEGYTKTLKVEQPFNFEMPDGLSIGGRWDSLIKQGSQARIRDWKTTTKQVQYFRESLDPNDQATRYIYAHSVSQGWNSTTKKGSALSSGVEFVIIQNMKPTKTQKNPPKIERFNVTRSAEQLVSFEQDQLVIHEQIKTCRDNDVWPMSPTNCGFCDYKHVCRAPTDGSREAKLRTEFAHSPWDHQTVDQKVSE